MTTYRIVTVCIWVALKPKDGVVESWQNVSPNISMKLCIVYCKENVKICRNLLEFDTGSDFDSAHVQCVA